MLNTSCYNDELSEVLQWQPYRFVPLNACIYFKKISTFHIFLFLPMCVWHCNMLASHDAHIKRNILDAMVPSGKVVSQWIVSGGLFLISYFLQTPSSIHWF